MASSYFPQEVVEHILHHLVSHRDRNACSLVCSEWHAADRRTRRHIFVPNSFSIKPTKVVERFPGARSLNVECKYLFVDTITGPWGAFGHPWVEAAAAAAGWSRLEEIRFKGMIVTDACLGIIAESLRVFKELVLVRCEGFSTDGLGLIAKHCRFLRVLDVKKSHVRENDTGLLSYFPDSCTSLVSLDFTCLRGPLDIEDLLNLVKRCPHLKRLRLNQTVSMAALAKILAKAPQLLDLGTGSFFPVHQFWKLRNSLVNCRSLRSVSGFWNVHAFSLPIIFPFWFQFTALNLSNALTLQETDIMKIISCCDNLQKLKLLDWIGDEVLEKIGSKCKELKELIIYQSHSHGDTDSPLTEKGLMSISMGCLKLQCLVYTCSQMANASLINVAKNCQHITRFKLCILDRNKPDCYTGEPLDEGICAIVESCKNLRRLSVSGCITDQALMYIAVYGDQLEKLTVAFASCSESGMMYVMNGCKNLRKLEIMHCPFSDNVLLNDPTNYEKLQSILISSCNVTLPGCETLASAVPGLNMEIIHRDVVEEVYMYKSLIHEDNDTLVRTVYLLN